MSSLTVKRIFVVVLSQVLGFVTSYLIITVGFNSLPAFSAIETPQGRTIMEYGPQYFFWTFFPIGVVFMIWLDVFFETEILPD
jgi:hypothetical protein